MTAYPRDIVRLAKRTGVDPGEIEICEHCGELAPPLHPGCPARPDVLTWTGSFSPSRKYGAKRGAGVWTWSRRQRMFVVRLCPAPVVRVPWRKEDLAEYSSTELLELRRQAALANRKVLIERASYSLEWGPSGARPPGLLDEPDGGSCIRLPRSSLRSFTTSSRCSRATTGSSRDTTARSRTRRKRSRRCWWRWRMRCCCGGRCGCPGRRNAVGWTSRVPPATLARVIWVSP